MAFADLPFLSVPLPEDILHAREYGDFALALRLIDARLADGRLPEALGRRLSLEKEILSLLPDEYTVTEEAALARLREDLGAFSREELDKLLLERELDWAYVGGRRLIHHRAIANLYKTRDDLARRAFDRGKRDDPGGASPLLDAVIAEMKAKGEVTVRFRVRTEMTVQPGPQPRPVRVWLPIPRANEQNREIRVLSLSHPEGAHIDSPEALQRTVCMQGLDTQPFRVEYAFDVRMRYTQPDPDLVSAEQPAFFTGEQAPHMLFTPYLRALCKEITGEETNPLRKARLIYEFVTYRIRYSFMRAYYTLPMITEYAAANLRGDCGVQALLFITLCRIAGIPARWQSGVYLAPGDVGSHDWARFYVAPYGWLYADCSFGGSAVRRGAAERAAFYFGNLEPFRMAANDAFQEDFEIPPRFPRCDPYDNQVGEAEYGDGPVPRDCRSTSHTVLEVSGLETPLA